jgi:proteasome accessory factor A
MVERAPAFFGIETEYAVSVLGADAVSRENAVKRIYQRAVARPHLPGIESGIFLTNGGRFYIDCGSHPEYAAPETTNPWDGVRYAAAGDRHIWQLADEVARESPQLSGLVVRKGNVDYSSRTTWASHENYLHRCAPVRLRPALVSHLVSRIIFTGSGGFHPNGGARPPFVLSPRALFIRSVIGQSAQNGLALVDERNQPHCAGFFRQHVMCGDATESHLATFLRIGTTALVVALIDTRCITEGELVLAKPLEALGIVTHDDTLQAPLILHTGEHTTALDLQRRYLERALANLDRLPVWASRVCDVWQDTIDRLARGPEAVADRLDWAIKRAMFLNRASRWGQHSDHVQAELYEIDMRFGQIYPASLFQSLDEAGVLHHRVPDVDAIDEAVSKPPADGRARIRGEVVARLGRDANGAQCGWDTVRDAASKRMLDLSSPFASREEWNDIPAARTSCQFVLQMATLATRSASPSVTIGMQQAALRIMANQNPTVMRSGQDAIDLNNHAVDMRLAGRLEDAEWLMRAALAIDLAAPHRRKLPHRRNNLAAILLLQRRIAEAREEVTLAWRLTGTRYDRTSVRALVVRLAIAFVDGEPADVFIGQLKSHLATWPLPDFAGVEARWRARQMFEALNPLTHDERALLTMVAEVLNSERQPSSLDDLPRWRDTPAQPLDSPWP